MHEKKKGDEKNDVDRDRHKRSQRDDRETHMSSHAQDRNDGFERWQRDDSERSYYKSLKSSHSAKDTNHSPQRRRGDFDRSKEVSQKSEMAYRNKSDNSHKSEDNINHSRKTGEKATYDICKDRQSRDDRRERHRSPDDRRERYKSSDDHKSSRRSYDEWARSKNSSARDEDGLGEDLYKRKRDRKEFNKGDREMGDHIRNSSSSSVQHERQLRNVVDEASLVSKGCTSLKKKFDFSEASTENAQVLQEPKTAAETEKFTTSSSKFSSEPSVSFICPAAATVAAMKAAEIVNRNLVGGGGLSITEQKKKLLWGNKKNTEESSSHWDLSLIPDRERQEKFKKLMSLSLSWYISPIVGCERRYEDGNKPGRQGWQSPSKEAGGAADGFGETIHCRAPTKGWPNCWPWPVTCLLYLGCFVEQISRSISSSVVSILCTGISYLNIVSIQSTLLKHCIRESIIWH